MSKTLTQSSSGQALFFACLVLIVGFLSIDLYNPSLPAMVRLLHIEPATVKALASTYLIGFGVSQLIYGPFSDRFGRKKTLLVSLTIAVGGNLLTMTAHNGSELLWYRFITGLGAGGCPAISRAILRDSFTSKKTLTHAFSVLAMSSQISPGLAPMAGGVIEHYFGWQYNFAVLALITFFALFLVLLRYQETNKSIQRVSFKHLLTNYCQLMTNWHFLGLSVLSGVIFVYTMGYYTLNPFVFQQQFHLNAAENGFIFIFFAVGLFLGANLMKQLTKTCRPEIVLLYGLIGLCVFSGLMCLINAIWVNMPMFIAEGFVLAILCGLTAPTLISLALLPFPEKAGAAGALQGTLKMTIGGLLLMFIAQYHVSTTLDLSYVMLMTSGGVLILTLLLLKPVFGKAATAE